MPTLFYDQTREELQSAFDAVTATFDESKIPYLFSTCDSTSTLFERYKKQETSADFNLKTTSDLEEIYITENPQGDLCVVKIIKNAEHKLVQVNRPRGSAPAQLHDKNLQIETIMGAAKLCNPEILEEFGDLFGEVIEIGLVNTGLSNSWGWFFVTRFYEQAKLPQEIKTPLTLLDYVISIGVQSNSQALYFPLLL